MSVALGGVQRLCAGGSRGNLLGRLLEALGRVSLIASVRVSFPWMPGTLSPRLKALPPMTLRDPPPPPPLPRTEAAQSKVPVSSLQGKSFSKILLRRSEGLRAQSAGKGVPTRRNVALKSGLEIRFPSWAILPALAPEFSHIP